MTSTTDTRLAIDGGTPVRTAAFPDRSASVPIDHPEAIAALESEFASFLGDGAEAIACRDGATAYALALETLAISQGEAVVPALASAQSAEAMRVAGLTIVPAEVEADSVNLGPRGLARAISEQTAVVTANHAFGHPYAAAELLRILEPRQIPLIEDASAALGGAYRLQPAGLLGSVALFAFGESHLLRGNGAILATADLAVAARLRGGRDRAASGIAEAGAQLALADLRTVEDELAARRHLAWELTFDLRGKKAISGMSHSRWVMHSYDRYVVRVRSLLWERPLDETVAALNAEGIPAVAALHPSLHLDPDIRAALGDDERLEDNGFPVARRLPGELIALPMHGGMTDLEIADIAVALEKLEAASR